MPAPDSSGLSEMADVLVTIAGKAWRVEAETATALEAALKAAKRGGAYVVAAETPLPAVDGIEDRIMEDN